MAVLATAVTVLGLAGLLRLLRLESRWAVAAKAVASLGFVGIALARDATATRYGWLILVGLGFGLLGDLLLEWRSAAGFLLGLGAFFLGHLVYLAGFLLDGPDWAVVGIALLVTLLVGVGVAVWLHAHLPPDLVVAVRAYIVVIAAMTAAAVGLAGTRPLATAGAIAFFASDVAVARDRFVAASFANRAWGLPLYYLGQVLIAWSI